MNLAKEISDWVLGMGLFINAALFVPQIYNLYKTKDSKGISLVTFGGFCLIQMTAIVNGYYYDNWSMMYGYGLSLITCGLVTLLAVYYRLKN